LRQKPESVFVLWHSHEIAQSEDDSKLIGIYKTREEAEAARARVEDKPGFRDTRNGFEIVEYILGRDGWTEGYISGAEALEPSGEAGPGQVSGEC
jgi:hypothetical protein